MTTIEIAETCCEPPRPRLSVPVPQILSAFVGWRRRRRTFACLSRLPEHLMRDAGVDPDAVYDAVPGRWEEAHPGRSRIR